MTSGNAMISVRIKGNDRCRRRRSTGPDLMFRIRDSAVAARRSRPSVPSLPSELVVHPDGSAVACYDGVLSAHDLRGIDLEPID